jgi:hypothetical protein
MWKIPKDAQMEQFAKVLTILVRKQDYSVF